MQIVKELIKLVPKNVSVLTSIHKTTIIASIGDKKVECLLDSGVQLSCISKSFLSITNLQGSKLESSDIPENAGVGGERHRILSILEAPITISKTHFQCKLFVLHDPQHPVILGIDFLDSYKADIDFGKKLIYIEDKLVRTSIKHSDAGLARLCKHTEIPQNSQMNVLVMVSLRKVGDQVLLEPAISLNNHNLAGANA